MLDFANELIRPPIAVTLKIRLPEDAAFGIQDEHAKISLCEAISDGIDIELRTNESIFHAMHRVVVNKGIPWFVEEKLYESLVAALDSELHRLAVNEWNESARETRLKIDADVVPAKELHSLVRSESSNQPQFPRAYAKLVCSTIPHLFDGLLQLERNYARALQDVWEAHERDMKEMRSRHDREREHELRTNKNGQLNVLYDRHEEEIENAETTWTKTIHETSATQRREYQDFIIRLYQEVVSSSSLADITNYDDAVETVIEKMTITKPPSIEIRSLSRNASMLSLSEPKGGEEPRARDWEGDSQSSALPGPSDPSAMQDDELPYDPNLDPLISKLTSMGFTRFESHAALEISNKNVEEGINLLLEKPDIVKAHMNARREERRVRKRDESEQKTSEFSISPPKRETSFPSPASAANRSRILERAKAAAAGTSSGAAGPRKFSPKLFLQNLQQSNNSNSVKSPSSAQTPKQSAPSSSDPKPFEGALKKLGSFFGKLADLEFPESPKSPNSTVSDSEDMSETFTVYLGTQVRRMYCLRVVCMDSESAIKWPVEAVQETAIRAQTASELYGENLRGMIVLVRKHELMSGRYAQGRLNKSIMLCKRSTDFHFGDVEEQLRRIIGEEGKGSVSLESMKEGDFFITRHSNLPLLHVIFHLVIDEDSMKGELSSRSPILTGLRNIIRTCTHFDIANITIPVFLLPDAQVPLTPDADLIRRSETILKVTRATFVERERGVKHGIERSGIDSKGWWVSFLVGRRRVYEGVKERVSEVFRTS